MSILQLPASIYTLGAVVGTGAYIEKSAKFNKRRNVSNCQITHSK